MYVQHSVYQKRPLGCGSAARLCRGNNKDLLICTEKAVCTAEPVNSAQWLSNLLAHSPVQLTSLVLDTTNFRFDREEANAR